MRDLRAIVRRMSTERSWGEIPTTAAFGARLALIRWQMGWNQKEAALACGLPHASWREWELSGRAPRNLVEVATKISRKTGISDYWVMTGKVTADHDPNGGGSNVTDGFPRQPVRTVSRLLRSDSLRATNLQLAA